MLYLVGDEGKAPVKSVVDTVIYSTLPDDMLP